MYGYGHRAVYPGGYGGGMYGGYGAPVYGGYGYAAAMPQMMNTEYDYQLERSKERYKNRNRYLCAGFCMLFGGLTILLLIVALIVAGVMPAFAAAAVTLGIMPMFFSITCFTCYCQIREMERRRKFVEARRDNENPAAAASQPGAQPTAAQAAGAPRRSRSQRNADNSDKDPPEAEEQSEESGESDEDDSPRY